METDLMGKNITISIGKFPVEARFGRQLGFLKRHHNEPNDYQRFF